MDATLDYGNRPATRPLSERVNFRMIGFLALVLLPFLWCLWLIVDQRVAVKHGDYYVVDLKGMGNFPLDPIRDAESAIPQEVRDLDGKKVKFEGEMYAPDAASNRVKDFQLVYSIVECCLGGPPKVQERVFAHVPDTIAVPNYTGRQVTVIGTLRIAIKREGNEAVSVFTMDVDEVKERT